MKKSKNQIFKTLNISLIVLALGVLVVIFLGSFLISCANPKPTPTPIDTTKITGYNGTTDNVIFDNSNNLYFTNYDNDNKTKHVYKVEHDTTNAIQIISRKEEPIIHTWIDITLDKNNNLYISVNETNKDLKWFKVEHDTTNAVEVKINGITNSNINQIWFDNDNNMFIDYRENNTTYKFYEIKHDTTNAIEITGISGPVNNQFQFDSENNLWIQSGQIGTIKLYEIKHDTTNSVEIKLNGITDYTNFLWTIDNKDNLYFSKYNSSESVYDILYRFNKNTIKPIKVWNSKNGLKGIWYKNKDNLYFQDQKNNFYQINSNSTTAIKITGYNDNADNVIFDKNNNLWISTDTNSEIPSTIYKVEHDTTNAIKITGNYKFFNKFNIDKNNNLYFVSDKKLYEIENNKIITKQLEIPNYKKDIFEINFDKTNNLFFIGNDNQLYKTTNFIK